MKQTRTPSGYYRFLQDYFFLGFFIHLGAEGGFQVRFTKKIAYGDFLKRPQSSSILGMVMGFTIL